MTKSPDAFRTISEVAEWLDTPAHVLRFWESKFAQVKPVKRAGGRRYYRPADMELLGGIKKLLHDDGMTIKGVQKILSERGIKAVAALSQPVDPGAVDTTSEEAPLLEDAEPEVPVTTSEDDVADFAAPPEEPATDTVVPFVPPRAEPPAREEDDVLTEAPVAEDPAEWSEPQAPAEHRADAPQGPADVGGDDEAAPRPVSMQGDLFAAAPQGGDLPSFLQTPFSVRLSDDRAAGEAEDAAAPDAAEADMPETADAVAGDVDPPPVPGVLAHLARIRRLDTRQAEAIAPLAARLRARVGA
ncbi:MerR family transcriptional regulator [Roseivivax isoporae]|uniref:Trancriptional regulator, MerR family n=1 Tax=Roseivivax isoporae LMG 25204 TaxID=1449351 RepID=X7F6D2_9RHOB|nr:MerR family transcriptional regulator [Roseivivax isoporae]ETX28365.1 trancriptional regulator, MerR family [Roseivivax isoporae LMG 25204]